MQKPTDSESSKKSRQTAQSGFFAQVHALVALIPAGKVMTYGQIADVLQNICSARYVGYALRAAKDKNLPCHRVVNRNGDLSPGGNFGGRENHRRKLEEEGVPFTAQGRIDIEQCRFDPKEP